MNSYWPADAGGSGLMSLHKNNTALLYDDNNNVKSWGYKALTNNINKPSKKKKKSKEEPIHRPVELFKLHLGKDINTLGSLKSLDEISKQCSVDYKKAIVD